MRRACIQRLHNHHAHSYPYGRAYFGAYGGTDHRADATEPTAEPTEAPVESPAAPVELPENVQGLASADEVTAFLDAVYAKVPAENLPMMLMHTPLDLSDMDAVTYNTGLTSVEGIDGIVVSESGVGSIAYSLVYIMTADGADADAIPG